MKLNFSIQKRIFLTFFLFIIALVNAFAYGLYYFITYVFVDDMYQKILNKYDRIEYIIDQQPTDFLLLDPLEVKNINEGGFFSYIEKNGGTMVQSYQIGFQIYESQREMAYKKDYKGYNIVIGKSIQDLYVIQKNFIKITLFLNIVIISMVLIITYYLSNSLLLPIKKLSSFLANYEFEGQKKLFPNTYSGEDIGRYIDVTNRFLERVYENFESQKYFVQDVSHELKTPLMQLESSIEYLEGKVLEEKYVKKLQHMKQSIVKMNTILTGLGFLLRFEENIKPTSIDLGEYFHDFIEEFEDLAKQKNIVFRVEIIESVVIQAHSYYLDVLLRNLIVNAILYNDGNNTIVLRLDRYGFSISDNGIGIDLAEQKKIFDRFYRNQNSNLYAQNGSGLGLSLVKKVCDIFHWTISLDSKVGEGTTFFIKFGKK